MKYSYYTTKAISNENKIGILRIWANGIQNSEANRKKNGKGLLIGAHRKLDEIEARIYELLAEKKKAQQSEQQELEKCEQQELEKCEQQSSEQQELEKCEQQSKHGGKRMNSGRKRKEETTHMRVPVAIKAELQAIIEHYKKTGEMPKTIF